MNVPKHGPNSSALSETSYQGININLSAVRIVERRSAVMKCWSAFLNNLPLHVVDEVVERCSTDLPDQFVAWAPGILVASNWLLQRANYCPGSCRPSGWLGDQELFWKPTDQNWLHVRRCGNFWTVERDKEVLVFIYGSMPIFTRTHQAAMRLADHCHPHPHQVGGLRWVTWTPAGMP
jgi:hypothetical protein